MKKRVRSRRIIALAAAYVVALQALILPLSVAAGGPFAVGICASSVDAPEAPGHDSGCPCAAGCGMACCVQALIGPPQGAVALFAAYVRVTTPGPATDAFVRPSPKGPQIPRAPPAA
ncbi:MAG: hypothetical protein WAM62_03490 [Pseudolabrys sp.]